jgi:hexosaminidase
MQRLALAALCCAVVAPAQNLMPLPAKMAPGSGRLVIDGGFRVAISGDAHALVRATAARTIARLARQTGMQVGGEIGRDWKAATLVLDCKGPATENTADESYILEVTPKQAVLAASNFVGLARGVETFLQLIEPYGEAYAAPAIRIEDQPRFPWRGLLIDSARHFLPVENVKRTLDGMAAVKLNVLHWHLTDDQGFRVESHVFPKLHQLGSDGLYYTQAEIRDIIRYAWERGIRVMPEFEMPGHITSWFVGYPELASGPGPYQLMRGWGIFDPALDPTRDENYDFLQKLIFEMASLFTDPYFHIGGDEVNGKQWDQNEKIQEYKRQNGLKDNQDLQAAFNKRVQQILAQNRKKMVGWDEILHPDLPKDIVVQSWRGQKSLGAAARQGFQGLLSAGWYLDHMLPASVHYEVDPLSKEAGEMDAQAAAKVLGGEACMWAEFISPEMLDSRVWPRTAAIAERLWSPREVRDVASMYRRLEAVSRWLEFLGLTHRSSLCSMLERLAGTHEIGPLMTLAEVVEPVRFYQRGQSRQYTQQTPLNRLIDAARPESDTAREFGELVGAFLRDRQAHAAEIRARLVRWQDNDAALAPLIASAAALKEVAPVSRDLTTLAAAGLEAMDFLSGKRAPQGWIEKQKAQVEAARKPKAEVLVQVAPAVEKLVEAVGRIR